MNGLVEALAEFEEGEGVLVDEIDFIGGSADGEVFPADCHVLRGPVEGFGQDLVEESETLGNLNGIGGAPAVDVRDERFEFEFRGVGKGHGQVGVSAGNLNGGDIVDAFGTPCNTAAWTKSDYVWNELERG